MAAQQLSVKARALRCLAQREHSRAELERKLLAQLVRASKAVKVLKALGAPESLEAAKSRGPASASSAAQPEGTDDAQGSRCQLQEHQEQIREVLDGLVARGLLSDTRTAEAVLTGPGRRLGHRRLKHVLQSKGLAPDLVAATLQQSRATELDRARSLWQRRFGEPAADAAGRARQARFLAGRGFDADIVRRVVKGLEDER